MKPTKKPVCGECEQLRQRVDALEVELTQMRQLRDEIALLRQQLAQARKNSSTSSKPPSSDIVKPPKPPSAIEGKRSIGGQPGHPFHERTPFPPEQITHRFVYPLEACPCCGGELRLNAPFAKVQQRVDILKPPLVIEEHTSPEYWCAYCQKSCSKPMPLFVTRGGVFGPEILSWVAYLKGPCHASYSTIRFFFMDVVGLTISRSQLHNLIDKVKHALADPYEELKQLLPDEARLNVDETGHKDNGKRWWTWCFRAQLYTLFRIEPTRSASVLLDTLGSEFDGVLGCDYFSAYRKYMRECSVQVQFCLAHLIRDVKFLTTLPDPRDQQYGEALRLSLKELFCVFHQRETLGKRAFGQQLQVARDRVLQVGLAPPPTRHGQTLGKRFAKHGQSYFTFVTTPGIEPTNNLVEQAIRFVVIDRLITQGTRSEKGRQFCERIWTVIATCVQQGKSPYAFLREAIENDLQGWPAPTLTPGADNDE